MASERALTLCGYEELCDLRILSWQRSQHRPPRASGQTAYCLILPTPHQWDCEDLENAGGSWMAVAEPPTPHGHSPGCTSGRKEGREEGKKTLQAPTLPKGRNISCTQSCYLCLVTDRTPTHGGPNSRSKGRLDLPTLLRMAWEMGQEAPLNISKG